MTHSYDTIEPYKIIRLVEDEFGLKVTERTRRYPTIKARFACIHLIRKYSKLSLPQICKYMPVDDHTSILNALRRSEEMMKEDKDYYMKLTMLDEELNTYLKNKNNVL